MAKARKWPRAMVPSLFQIDVFARAVSCKGREAMATKNILDTQFLRWTFLLAASLLALPHQSLAQNDKPPAPAPAAATPPAAQSSAAPAATPAAPQQPATDPLSNVV